MNKLIFQLGILGFCVSAVMFGVNGGSLLEIVSRAFLVFVGIVLAALLMLVVGGSMIDSSTRRQSETRAHQTPERSSQQQP